MQKKANPLARLLKNLDRVSRNPYVNIGRMGAGGAGGFYANDAYLDQVNPDVSDMGRMRSNLIGAALGAGLSTRGALINNRGIPMLRKWPTTLAAGGGLGLRYGYLMPGAEKGGLGDLIDPGPRKENPTGSQIQRGVSALWHPETHAAFERGMQAPVTNTLDSAQKGVKWLFDKAMDYKADGGKAQSLHETGVSKLKDEYLPTLYSSLIQSLGSKPSEKPTFVDVGMAVAPHATGALGGGYLGYLLSRAAGNYVFKDDPRADYEERRRQESRRNWLNFFGSNLGVVGGVLGTAKAMPQLNALISKYVTQQPQKQASALSKQANPLRKFIERMRQVPADVRALPGNLKRTTLDYLPDIGGGAAITAGQYASGIVPPGSYDSQGRASADPAYGLAIPLTGLNTYIARKTRHMVHNPNYYARRQQTRTGDLVWKNPLVGSLAAGTGVAAGPSITNIFSTLWPGVRMNLKFNDMMDNNPSTLKDTADPQGTAMKYWEEKGQPELLNMVGGRAKNIAEQAGVPGFGNKQLSQALTAGVLSTIAQGGGIAAGGLTGMLGSNWLADKLLTLATKKKLLKKRPRLHALIRDLSGLLGAGLGAYGTMRLMNRVIPAYANRGEAAAAGAEKGTADAKAPQQPAAQQSAATAAAKAVGQEAAKPAGK